MQAISNAARVFEDRPAVRTATPLLFGLIGPSGSGKTYSALRLAAGMQRVIGGDIFVVDTESDRALHYSDTFKFRHVPFAPPFSPLDYIAAIQHCVNRGAKTIIIDSLSHEHSGQGGVLEWHAAEVERIMAAWRCSEEKANIPAWNAPKAARRKLINCITQAKCNLIACFRAKDKIKIGNGKVVQLGWMPDAGEEFVFELTAKALLLPGAGGIPTLQSEQPGEQMMIKIPQQFRNIFSGAAGKPLDESIGEQMARWAAGGTTGELADGYARCADKATFDALETRRAEIWSELTATEKKAIKAASEAAAERIAKTPAATKTVDKETGEVLTLDGNRREPGYTEASAIAALEAAFRKGSQELTAAWSAIAADFAERDAEIPIGAEAKFTELRDALADQEQPL